jgi:hypothetical protein
MREARQREGKCQPTTAWGEKEAGCLDLSYAPIRPSGTLRLRTQYGRRRTFLPALWSPLVHVLP